MAGQQPEKRENSVLFSLRELRQIEETRVQEEESAAQAAEEARIRAKMEEDRRKQEAEAARLRAIEEEERRIRDEEANRAHEANVRIGEAQARANAEAQARIEQERLQHEMELRRQEVAKKRPTWLLVVAGVLVVAIAASIFLIVQRTKEKDAESKRANEEAAAKIEAEKRADRYKAELDAAESALARIEREIEEADKAIEQADAVLESATATSADKQQAKAKREAAKAKRTKVKEEQANVKKTIKVSKECLQNPLGC
jgi:hypothetical protein